MKLFKFGAHKKRADKAEVMVYELRQELVRILKESYELGEGLRDEIFIPEYLGFQESTMDNEESGTVRIYSRDGFNISRASQGNTWIMLHPSGAKVSFTIEKMFDAIIVLKSLGLNISITDYLKQTPMTDKFNLLLYGPDAGKD